MGLPKFNTTGFVVSVVMILIVAVFGLWLFSQFFNVHQVPNADGTTSWVTEWIPTTANQVSSTTMTAIKYLIVFVAVFLSYILVMKVTGDGFSKKDVLTMILLAIGLWFLWDKILVHIFVAPNLGNITMAMIKP